MRTRIVVGGVGALGLVALAAVLAPRIAGSLMITFSIIAFLWAAIGLLKPAWARLPDRMAAVWVWAISFGLFLGGGALLAPPPEVSNSNGLTAAESPEEREARVAARMAATAAERERAAAQERRSWTPQGREPFAMLNCPEHVERLAAYDFRWVDGILDPKFSRLGWRDEPSYLAVYLGDQIEFQNPQGGWVRHSYSCIVDVRAERVVEATAIPGRLPR